MQRSLFSGLGWFAAIYLAVAFQTAFAEEALPVFTAMVAGRAIAAGPSGRGILWAAVAGLACDAAGHDRLGPHLLCYSTAAAMSLAAVPGDRQRRLWLTAPMAGWLAVADRLCGQYLRAGYRPEAWDWQRVAAAGLTTALTVFAGLVVVLAAQRLLQPRGGTVVVRLSNRWLMLTE